MEGLTEEQIAGMTEDQRNLVRVLERSGITFREAYDLVHNVSFQQDR